MTDRPDAHELASALHDGEAADHERARAGDPDVVAAREVVTSIADRIADVPPPPAGLLDDHVSTALEAFGQPADDPHGELDAPASHPSDDRRVVQMALRRRWTERLPLGAVAAAVVAVALVGALGLAGLGDDDRADDTATAALDDAEVEADDGSVAETFDAEAGGTSLTGGEREAYGTYDELADALAERVVGAEGADTTASPAGGTTSDDAMSSPAPATEEAERSGASGCDPVAGAGLDGARVRLVSAVRVADRLVTAIVHDAGDGLRLTVVDDEDCDVIEERPLAG